MGRRSIHRCFGLAALLLLAGALARSSFAAPEPLLLGDDDRILVLAPHPSDETLAAGGLIQEALALDLPVRVCFFTMGDNNEIAALFTRRHPLLTPGATRASGMLRRNEALAAVTQLGLSTNDVVFLGYPDSGTLDIWKHHWRTVPPYRSPLTRANTVPYDTALTPGSAYAGEDILDDLVDVLRDFRPTYLVLPQPADHNVDHRALYLFARVALWNLEADGPAPEILSAPVHFTQWPESRRYQPDLPATPPSFLSSGIDWTSFALAPFQVSNKLAALRRHHSQFLRSSAYLQSLVRKTEIFGDFPDVDLPGGMGSAEIDENDATQFHPDESLFRELAQEADSWNEIAGQKAAETAALADFDNDIIHRSISGDGDGLTLSFRFRRPVSKPVGFSLRLFGYRSDVPFGEMPKIEILADTQAVLAVYDLLDKIPAAAVEHLPSAENEIAVRVPFSLLGQPEKILAGAMLAKGSLPIDEVPWRAIDLSGAPLRPAPVPHRETPSPAPAAETAAPPPVVPPTPPAAVEKPAPPEMPATLAPRVPLPRRSIPDKTEANEPVQW